MRLQARPSTVLMAICPNGKTGAMLQNFLHDTVFFLCTCDCQLLTSSVDGRTDASLLVPKTV